MEPIKTTLHPRNPHRGLYDFKQLIKCCPELVTFVIINQYGKESINFANPSAVPVCEPNITSSGSAGLASAEGEALAAGVFQT